MLSPSPTPLPDLTTLSPSQVRAVQAFEAFLLDDTAAELVISGFAGSGKSYLITYLDQLARRLITVNRALQLRPPAISIHFTATTNKAAQVLSEFTGQPTSTIHGLLALKVKNDFKSGKTQLVTTDSTGIISGTLIFVDEASMVDRQLYSLIKTYTKGSKVVYVGDRYQLPPIFEDSSPVFSRPSAVHLQEIQRQAADNPVIAFSQAFRTILDRGPPFVWPTLPADCPQIEQLDGDTFKTKVVETFSRPHDPGNYKILCYTNARVIQYNAFVRGLYTTELHFIVGESVMTNAPIYAAGLGHRIVCQSDMILPVTAVHPGISPDNLEGYEIQLNHQHSCFQARDPRQVDTLLKGYAKTKDWPNYFRVKEFYADLRSLHASTCHKAQGSTYKEVFVDLKDIDTNKKWWEIARLVYVAMTRASEKVYFYGQLSNRWNKA